MTLIIGKLTLIGQSEIRKYIHDYSEHDLYIAWGICSVSDVAHQTDTSLVNEIARHIATVSASGDALTISLHGSTGEVLEDSYEILEVGIFTGVGTFTEATGGVMLYRGLLSEDSTTAKSRWINAGDTLKISIVFDFANGAFV